jgi:hypothetical protein
MKKPKRKPKAKGRTLAQIITANWKFLEDSGERVRVTNEPFPVDQTGSHLDANPFKSPFGEGEPNDQVPHLSDAIQTIGHVLGSGFYANQRGRKGLLIQHMTLKHLQPRSTQEGIDRDAWYRAIYQGIIALARSPQHFLRSDDSKNPWRLPKSIQKRIGPWEGRFPEGTPFSYVNPEYGTWRTPLSRRQMNRPLAHFGSWEQVCRPENDYLQPRPTKAQWREELAFRKRIARRNWAEDQKYLLPCAWTEGRRLAAEDEKQRQEQAKRQAEKPAWIPEGLCITHGVYEVQARNFGIGIYDGEGNFYGARYKHDPDPYLFAERHWDQGAPSGTAKPVRKIEQLPPKLIKHLDKYLENRSISAKPLLNYLTKLAKKLAEDSSSISSQKT